MTNNLYILILFLLGSSIFADEPIALITKSRGKLKYKNSSESKYQENAQVNTPIFHGNGIKTKAKSFSKIVYLDDRSTVFVYPKTDIIINGTIDDRMINKKIDVNVGIVRVKVYNQIMNQFTLTTPHSELTCNKCDFWVISDKDLGDQFYNISGKIIVTNITMIKTMELVNNSKIISLKNTEMKLSKTPVDERKYLELLMIDAEEMPDKIDVGLAKKSKLEEKSPETTSNILEIRLKNALNIKRTIILTYTK